FTKTASAAVAGDRMFTVAYTDLPIEVDAGQVKRTLTDYGRGLKGKGGKLVSEKSVPVGTDKLPGRDVLIEQPNNYLRVRAVLHGKRLYQVIAAGPKEFVTSKDADKVIESVEVVK